MKPFNLEIEGFEAGHSAAESVTNNEQIKFCIGQEDGSWLHPFGLRIRVQSNGEGDDCLVARNEGKEKVTITHLSRMISFPVDVTRPHDTVIHYFGSCWQSEFQYRCISFFDADLYPVSVHPVVKSFAIESKGSYTTCTYIPFVAVENRVSGETLFLAFEPSANWRIEVGLRENEAYIAASETDLRHCDQAVGLKPGESYTAPRALYGKVKGGMNEVVAALTRMRRGGSTGTPRPVVFNDYMNCLWAQPSEQKTYALIDAAARAGAEVFCIDDGWQHELGASREKKLGDWNAAVKLFGEGGLFRVIEYIRCKGMVAGLWFELEVAGENSEVYSCPDEWFLMRNGKRVGGGSRVFFELRNPQVREYLMGKLRAYYRAGVRYIKNDYNDCIGNCGADGVSYTRAVRAFYEEVRAEFPDLMMENCASGGMRCDNGLLRIFHLQSTSDQEIANNYPSIAQGALTQLLPEQAGIWAYPYPHLYDDFFGGNPVTKSSAREIAYTMLAGMSGVLYLSGRIDVAEEEGFALVRQGVACYKEIRACLAGATPLFPNGFVRIGEREKPVVILHRNGKRGYLFVWRQEGEETVIVPVAANGAEIVYPKPSDVSCACTEEGVTLHLPERYSAVLVELCF